MKIIDLLNKIANDDGIPKRIKYKGHFYTYDNDCHDYVDDFDEEWLGDYYNIINCLNDDIEIIEKNKKIKRLFHCAKELEEENQDIEFCFKNLNYMVDKINEIIEVLNNEYNK